MPLGILEDKYLDNVYRRPSLGELLIYAGYRFLALSHYWIFTMMMRHFQNNAKQSKHFFITLDFC